MTGDAPPSIQVVAAVVRRGSRYLLGLRPEDKRHGGLWEFPGGKMLDGEDLLTAADRELREEMAVRARSAGPVLFTVSDAGSPYVIHFLEIGIEGEPDALEHTSIGWFTPEELAGMRLAPADSTFAATLRR